ncbi:hypothetical protein [Paenisporosarcina antarctica]|uniref:hypothetical protein n=1 Tax=Paenisporosarcina antarctica TaxID=417367 RepID=UPI001AB0561F|nr:hypothetical protein [Paenisporosarcina antarctica]
MKLFIFVMVTLKEYMRKHFTFVDQQFVDLIDHTLFIVYSYEPPYKKGQFLRVTKLFIMEKKVPSEVVRTVELVIPAMLTFSLRINFIRIKLG